MAFAFNRLTEEKTRGPITDVTDSISITVPAISSGPAVPTVTIAAAPLPPITIAKKQSSDDHNAIEMEQKSRQAMPQGMIHFSDRVQPLFIQSLRLPGNRKGSSLIGEHVASFLAPKERKNWETVARIALAEYLVPQKYTYRDAWGTKIYNLMFRPLGAGYDNINNRVSVPAAIMINALVCNCNGGCSECGNIYEGGCCWGPSKRIDYVNNKAGIRFPDYVKETQLISDCCSNYSRSLLMTPITSACSAMECGCDLIHAAFWPCDPDYRIYKAAPASCWCPSTVEMEQIRLFNPGVAHYRGCTVDNYVRRDTCCDDCSNNSKFLANDLWTDCINTAGGPFVNVCCATTGGAFAYFAGTIGDCIYPNKMREVDASGQYNRKISIIVNDCIVVYTPQKPIAILSQCCSNAGYFRTKQGTIYYINKEKNIYQALDVSKEVIQIFDEEMQKKYEYQRNGCALLSNQDLKTITGITGHDHHQANFSFSKRALAEDDAKYDTLTETNARYARQVQADDERQRMPTKPQSVTMSRNDEKDSVTSASNDAQPKPPAEQLEILKRTLGFEIRRFASNPKIHSALSDLEKRLNKLRLNDLPGFSMNLLILTQELQKGEAQEKQGANGKYEQCIRLLELMKHQVPKLVGELNKNAAMGNHRLFAAGNNNAALSGGATQAKPEPHLNGRWGQM